MIIVLDTNVIISALLSSKGSPSKIIDLWEKNYFDIAVSKPLLKELERVLNYGRVKKYLSRTQGKSKLLIKRIQTVGIMVEPKERLSVIEKDHDDDRILECAVEANAKYIISGDEHLLGLKEYNGIIILPSAGFLALLDLVKS